MEFLAIFMDYLVMFTSLVSIYVKIGVAETWRPQQPSGLTGLVSNYRLSPLCVVN